jgi:hypothetical protein
MTKIVCACVECKHHSDKNTCTAKKVKLSYTPKFSMNYK